MQDTGNHNANPNPARSPVSLQGNPQSKFQLSAKLQAKLKKFGRWRIHPSSIEFLVDGRQFLGGYATVSQAVLVSSSDVKRQDNRSAKAGGDNSQGEEGKHEEQEPGAQSSERKDVAVKKLKIERNTDMERVLGLALRESELLLELDHPNVIKLEGFVEDAPNNVIWLVFPWEENGNLKDFLISEDWEIPERISLIHDVTHGLEHLHSRRPPICHGDLKSLNILVNSNYRAVITDFGSARRLGNENVGEQTREDESKPQPAPDSNSDQENAQLQATFCPTTNTITLTGYNYTTRWAAPELLSDDELPSLASDIWALGWIAYEVMTDTIPFHDVKNENIVVDRVVRGDLPSITNDARMSLIRALCWLMVQCWSINPSKRPTAEYCRKLLSRMPMIAPAPRQDMDTDASKSRNTELLRQVGEMYEGQGDYVNALSCYTKALNLCTSTSNATEKGCTLGLLSQLHLRRGEFSEAVACCSEALQIYTDADQQDDRALALFRLAQIHLFKDEYSDSIKLYSEALQIHTDTSNRRGRGLALTGLARAYVCQNEDSKATTLYSEASQIFTDIGDQRELAHTSFGLAEIHSLKDDFTEAIKCYSEALEIFTNIGDQREIANTLWHLAEISRAQGEYSEAIERYSKALRIDTEIGNKSGRADSLRSLAKIHRELDHHNEAIYFFVEASEVYRGLGNSEEAADALKQAADIRKRLQEAV